MAQFLEEFYQNKIKQERKSRPCGVYCGHGRVRQAEGKPRPQVSDRFVSKSCTYTTISTIG